jgi:hypothetical protein
MITGGYHVGFFLKRIYDHSSPKNLRTGQIALYQTACFFAGYFMQIVGSLIPPKKNSTNRGSLILKSFSFQRKPE